MAIANMIVKKCWKQFDADGDGQLSPAGAEAGPQSADPQSSLTATEMDTLDETEPSAMRLK